MKHLNTCLNSALALLLCLFTGEIWAQTILPEQQEGPYESMVFNSVFQSRNKIKSMTGRFSDKRDNMPIEKKPGTIEINFDRSGRIVRHFRVRTVGSLRDTSLHLWEYEENDLIAESIKNGRSLIRKLRLSKGDTTYTHSFRVSQEHEAQELLPKDRWWQSTSFQVKESRSGSQRIEYFNELHLPYKVEVSTYNDLGYLVERKETYQMSGRSERTVYRYDEAGRLVSRTIERSNGDTEEHVFEYDTSGLMTSWDVFKNEEKYRHLEVLYDERGLVDAFITLFEASQRIEIVQYEYEFYP
jgi:hypothetical protein